MTTRRRCLNPRSGRGAIVALLALWLACGATLAASGTRKMPKIALAPGDAAPPLELRVYPGGAKVAFPYEGYRLTLVNFWATWCTPCFEEMPALQRFSQRFRDDGFRVIGVYSDRVSWKTIYDMITPLGVTYQLGLALKATNEGWGAILSMPTSFLVDGDGRIVRRYVGATAEQIDGMEADIEAFLAGRPLPDMVLPENGNEVINPYSTPGQAAGRKAPGAR